MEKSFLRTGSAVLLAAAIGFSQNTTRPAFEVASVKPSPPLPHDFAGGLAQLGSSGVKINPVRADFIRVSLTDLIARAYRVSSFQISGPDWMNTAHFDIFAKLPDGASTNSVPEMLQTLLADRFKLTMQRAEKEFSVYVLALGNGGSKLAPKPTDYDRNAKRVTTPMTIENCAKLLADALDRPVLDQTSMEGEYMVPMDFISGVQKRALAQYLARRGMPDINDFLSVPSNSEVLGSVQALALSLEPRKLPLTVLVIDHTEKTPTEN